MLKFSWKICRRVLACALLLYLCFRYWPVLENTAGAILGAIMPLLFGGCIAFVINILMSFYERHYFPRLAHKKWVQKSRRAVCLPAALLTLLGIIALLIRLVIPELVHCVTILLADVPSAMESLLKDDIFLTITPESIVEYLSGIDWRQTLTSLSKLLLGGLGGAAAVVSSVVSGTFTVLLSFIFALYLLAGKEKLLGQTDRLARQYLPAKYEPKIRHWAQVFNHSFHRYISGQCVEAFLLGVLCLLGMLLFRFPYAVMTAALIFVTSFIPVVGAFIGAGIGALMILTVSPIQALLFLVFITVLQQLEGNLIYPRVVGTALGLPPLWVLAAVTVGSTLLGIPGLLFGVPTAAALYTLLKEDLHTREGNGPEATLFQETSGKQPGTHSSKQKDAKK